MSTKGGTDHQESFWVCGFARAKELTLLFFRVILELSVIELLFTKI